MLNRAAHVNQLQLIHQQVRLTPDDTVAPREGNHAPTTPVFLLALVAVAGSFGSRESGSSLRAESAGSRDAGSRLTARPAQTVSRPNILFAIADDWSFGHAGAYGATRVRTPAFDRVAREGVLFTRAYTPNAKCAPSRAILLTGRHSWQLEEAANHVPFFPPKFKTWSEALGEHGYVTGMTGKGWGPGVANDAQGKPRQMTGRPFNRHKSEAPTPAIAANDYATNDSDFEASAVK